MPSSLRTILFSLLMLLAVGAPCCGDPCSNDLVFNAPVPDAVLAPGDTLTVELFENVWAFASYCGGNVTYSSFPETTASSDHPRVASVWLEDTTNTGRPSLLHVAAHAPGRSTILLQARAEIDCEWVRDATHFRVTVSSVSSRRALSAHPAP